MFTNVFLRQNRNLRTHLLTQPRRSYDFLKLWHSVIRPISIIINLHLLRGGVANKFDISCTQNNAIKISQVKCAGVKQIDDVKWPAMTFLVMP